jgi:hypothetical protein
LPWKPNEHAELPAIAESTQSDAAPV